jgi:hypothetical protein
VRLLGGKWRPLLEKVRERYVESRHLQGCIPHLCQLRIDGLAAVSKYWTYRSHVSDMGPVSLIACHQQRVALLPLLQWLARERNWVRTRGSVSHRVVDYVGSSFSREQWLCPPLLLTSWKVAMHWLCEIRMIWDHTRTKRGMCVACWSVFPCRVYIDSNQHNSRIWVTACSWQSSCS